jgi:hypothetical protein
MRWPDYRRLCSGYRNLVCHGRCRLQQLLRQRSIRIQLKTMRPEMITRPDNINQTKEFVIGSDPPGAVF